MRIISDAWLAAANKPNQKPIFLVSFDDSSGGELKFLSGTSSTLEYAPIVASVSPVAGGMDIISRKIKTGESSVVLVDDGSIRTMLDGVVLKNRLCIIKIGFSDIAEEDFCPYFTGVVDEYTPTPGSIVVTVIEPVGLLQKAQVPPTGWHGRHPLVATRFLLTTAGIPESLIDLPSFDPANYPAIDYIRCSAGVTVKKTSGHVVNEQGETVYQVEKRITGPINGTVRGLVRDLAMQCSGSVVVNEEGKLSFARFEKDTPSVDSWTTNDYRDFKQKSTVENLINKVIFDISSYHDGAGSVVADITTTMSISDNESQEKYATPGGSSFVVEEDFRWPYSAFCQFTPAPNGDILLTHYSLGNFSGIGDSASTGLPEEHVELSSDRPLYILLGGQEIVKITAYTVRTYAQHHGKYSWTEADGSTTQQVVYNPAPLTYQIPKSITAYSGDVVRGCFGTPIVAKAGSFGQIESGPRSYDPDDEPDGDHWYNPLDGHVWITQDDGTVVMDGERVWTEEGICFDVTSAVIFAQEFLERHADGCPEIEVETTLAKNAVEVGDLISIQEPGVFYDGESGLGVLDIWEVTSKEIILEPSGSSIKWGLSKATTKVLTYTTAINNSQHPELLNHVAVGDHSAFLHNPTVHAGLGVTVVSGLNVEIAPGLASGGGLSSLIHEGMQVSLKPNTTTSIFYDVASDDIYLKAEGDEVSGDELNTSVHLLVAQTDEDSVTGLYDARNPAPVPGNILAAGSGPLANFTQLGEFTGTLEASQVLNLPGAQDVTALGGRVTTIENDYVLANQIPDVSGFITSAALPDHSQFASTTALAAVSTVADAAIPASNGAINNALWLADGVITREKIDSYAFHQHNLVANPTFSSNENGYYSDGRGKDWPDNWSRWGNYLPGFDFNGGDNYKWGVVPECKTGIASMRMPAVAATPTGSSGNERPRLVSWRFYPIAGAELSWFVRYKQVDIGSFHSDQKIRFYISYYNNTTGDYISNNSWWTSAGSGGSYAWTEFSSGDIGSVTFTVPDIGAPIRAYFDIRPWGDNSYTGAHQPWLIDQVSVYNQISNFQLSGGVRDNLADGVSALNTANAAIPDVPDVIKNSHLDNYIVSATNLTSSASARLLPASTSYNLITGLLSDNAQAIYDNNVSQTAATANAQADADAADDAATNAHNAADSAQNTANTAKTKAYANEANLINQSAIGGLQIHPQDEYGLDQYYGGWDGSIWICCGDHTPTNFGTGSGGTGSGSGTYMPGGGGLIAGWP